MDSIQDPSSEVGGGVKAQKTRTPNPMKNGANGQPHAGNSVTAASPRCGAKTRSGSPCRQIAGYKTDHVGQGRCNLHGGMTPVKHGRYSSITRTRIRDLIELHYNDPDPLDTFPELASARALFQDFIERYDENTAALIAWHRSRSVNPADQEALFAVVNEIEEIKRGRGEDITDQQEELFTAARRAIAQLNPDHQRPSVVLDIADAVRHLDTITRIVDRVEKARAANAISYEQLKRFLFGISRVIETRVTDPALLAQLQSDILAVNV